MISVMATQKKKSPSKKATPAKKAAPAKKSPAKKSSAKKAPAKKAPASKKSTKVVKKHSTSKVTPAPSVSVTINEKPIQKSLTTSTNSDFKIVEDWTPTVSTQDWKKTAERIELKPSFFKKIFNRKK